MQQEKTQSEYKILLPMYVMSLSQFHDYHFGQMLLPKNINTNPC
jgi:hypothetical protein